VLEGERHFPLDSSLEKHVESIRWFFLGGGADFFISLSCFNKRKKKIKIFRFSERNVVRFIRQEKKKGDKFTRGKNWAFPFKRKMEPLGLQFIFFFFFLWTTASR
jgi:hypothetical protein